MATVTSKRKIGPNQFELNLQFIPRSDGDTGVGSVIVELETTAPEFSHVEPGGKISARIISSCGAAIKPYDSVGEKVKICRSTAKGIHFFIAAAH